MWIAVQKDPQANLALSPEEPKFLGVRICRILQAQRFLYSSMAALEAVSPRCSSIFLHNAFSGGQLSSPGIEFRNPPLYFASSRELLKVAKMLSEVFSKPS